MFRSQVFLGLFVFLGAAVLAGADTIVSASTSLFGAPGPQCSKTDSLFAGCDAEALVNGSYLGASSFASNTWIYGPGGSLTTYAFGINGTSSASASVSFSDLVTIVRASGSGNLLVTFRTSWSYSSGPNMITPPGGGERIGDFIYGGTVFGPQFASSNYVRTLSFPVAFETPLPFSLGFEVDARGQERLRGYPESQIF